MSSRYLDNHNRATGRAPRPPETDPDKRTRGYHGPAQPSTFLDAFIR